MRKIANPVAVSSLAALLLALVFGGCSIGPAETNPARTYFLNPSISIEKLSANRERSDAATLLISTPRGQPGFDTARMAYLLRPNEVHYYAVNRWVDAPARMLARPLTQAMEETGLWRAVVQAPNTARTDYRLDCDNLSLEQQFFSNPSRVRIALRAQLVELKGRQIIAAREFEVFESASSEDSYGGVIAADKAVATLLQQLAAWLVTVMSEKAS
ncbi:MAG TPA: ABC-type transport auxiliary lipoprotein family protein [Candidatus Binatia bacterium]|jgi:cholesterol transport system auxiliary component